MSKASNILSPHSYQHILPVIFRTNKAHNIPFHDSNECNAISQSKIIPIKDETNTQFNCTICTECYYFDYLLFLLMLFFFGLLFGLTSRERDLTESNWMHQESDRGKCVWKSVESYGPSDFFVRMCVFVFVSSIKTKSRNKEKAK